MIIKLKAGTGLIETAELQGRLEALGVTTHKIVGHEFTVIGLVGDTSIINIEQLKALDAVASVQRIAEPYKRASRAMHTEDTIIQVGDVSIGGGSLTLIAGPCSVESGEQMRSVARQVKAVGAHILRGGAFKPRTSPYSFQGMGADGIELLLEAKKETGLPIVSEIMDLSDLPFFEDVDILQVGARNMQNFTLLKELGHLNKPILLKRGLSATYEEWLMSAEYIMSNGNNQVILCERGIRTFETATRNTLDLAAIPMLKSMTHLPIIIDPSHAAGLRHLVRPLSLAAVSAGADGVMIEVHNDPANALCDGPQSLHPDEYGHVAHDLLQLHHFCQTHIS